MRPLALIICVACCATPVWAEQSAGGEGDEGGERASEGETVPGGATIQGLVEDLSGQIGRLITDLPRERMDLVVVLVERGGASAQLRSTLQTLLLGALSRGGSLRSVSGESGATWADRARARSTAATQGVELLVWLEVTIEDNHLIVEGMAYETEHHLWREAVAPERQVLGQLFSRTRVNAEVRHYLAPISSGPLSFAPVPLGRQIYLALAVADVDGDDLNEIVLLSQRSLEIRSLRQGQAAVVSQLKLAGLPRAATPSRDPVGMVAVSPPTSDGSRRVALRTSDYSRGIVVSFDGREIQLQGTVTDFPIRWESELECTTVTPGRNTFQTEPIPCGSLGETATVPPFSALATEAIPRPGASPAIATATMLASGAVTLRWNEQVAARASPYGTALAISDLNDDGVAEVLLSSDRDPETGDELTILRLTGEGLAGRREQLGGVSGSVWVAAAGDADNDGFREFLAISQTRAGAELLVIE